MPGETNVQKPTTQATIISSDDIEPPTEITDPKLKKKVRSSDSGIESASGEDDDDEEEPRGRPRTAGQSSRGGSSGRDSAIGVNEVSGSGNQNFVFLGDFVDRGYFSLETFTLLMCLKAMYVAAFLLGFRKLTTSGILTRSPLLEATMNPARSLRSMASTRSVSRSTATLPFGSLAAKFSTFLFSLLSLMERFSAFTVV
jgi:hypothetical protein